MTVRTLQSAPVAMLMTLAAGLTSAATQNAADLEEIVVIGSRIRTSPLLRAQPLFEIDAEQMARQGLSSTVDALQRIPSAGGGLNSKFNNSGNVGNPPDGGGVGAGSAEIDLRYLSSRRVLVLVDGLRWVPGTAASGVPGSVDLNTIPTALISRMEVLQEGASPIYGSDAIAGVVNLITKSRQNGLIANVQIGQTDHGDGAAQDFNVSWGAGTDTTQLVVGGGYFRQEPIFAGDRAISRYTAPFATSCLPGGCSSATPLGRFLVSDPNTGSNPDLTLKQALQPGQRAVYVPGDPTGAASGFTAFTTTDRFNFQPYNYLSTPLERISVFGSLQHTISDAVQLRVRASYVQRLSANQGAPLPLFIGPDAGNGNLLDTLHIDATNPYNPFGFTLQPGTFSFLGRRLIENGPRHYAQTVDTWNLTGVLSGEWRVADKDWHWDVNALYSGNQARQVFTGNVNALRVQQALGPLAQCTAPCVPLNLFGGAGTITPAMLGFVAFTQRDASQQQLADVSANVTGDLLDLPAGPLAFAAGLERRHTQGYFHPDAIVAAGLSADIPAQPAEGQITVTEAYGELRLPLLADKPWVQRLEASVAARVFDYSTSGTGQTYQAGLTWRPLQELLVRGSYGQGFRSPSIGELFGTASRFDQEISDPCSGLLTSGASAVVRANCTARGVPGNGGYTQLGSQIAVITSGNRNLKPETSQNRTVSAAWEPAALKGTAWSRDVSIELAYSDIALDQAIQAQNGQTLLDRCAQTGDALSCATITRSASGQVTAIANPLINIGGIRTRALDLTLNWRAPESQAGQFAVFWSTTRLLAFSEFVPTSAGLATIERVGSERGSPDQAFPQMKSNLILDWSRGGYGATVTGRYLSAVREAGNPQALGARTYVDAQLRATPAFIGAGYVVALGINNLFSAEPPGCVTCAMNNFDPNAYDNPGRLLYLRLSYEQ